MPRVYFNETQRFRQWWIIFLILISIGFWAYGLIVSLHAPEGDKAASDAIMISSGIIPIGLVVLILHVKLETRIRKEGIYYRFRPFQLKEKHIPPGKIEKFEIRKYRPLVEYGGWGIRHGGKKYGKAYNVKGNIGLQLYLSDGSKLLIGTRKTREIKKAMDLLFSFKDRM